AITVSTRSGLRGPDAVSSPSRHVFLLVTAAARKALTSSKLWAEEVSRVSDLVQGRNSIFGEVSLQS
ncbi:hypothetical protein Tco_0618557, partial [Tanacetum coccineum]